MKFIRKFAEHIGYVYVVYEDVDGSNDYVQFSKRKLKRKLMESGKE